MSSNDTDILLIRKYLNGELDANAMHHLERRAQDDPFLMDAIDGYEKAKTGQQEQLNDLSRRLHERTTVEKKTRIIPWKMISIAASVIFIFFAGGWWFFNNGKRQSSPAAVLRPATVTKAVTTSPASPVAPQLASKPVISKPTIIRPAYKRSHVIQTAPSNNAPDALTNIFGSSATSAAATADSTPLNELVVMSMAEKKEKNGNVSKSALPVDAVVKGYAAARKRDSSLNPVQSIEGKVPGVTMTSMSNTVDKNKSYFYQNSSLSSNLISGRVIDKNDGQPIAGVTVKLAGTNKATLTDNNGRFKLNTDSGKAGNNLIVGYIGYQTANIPANSHDSLKTIAMVPANNSLNEVVVTAYPSGENGSGVTEPHPVNGWPSFNKYLKDNGKSPDHKTGIVKVSFVIDSNGTITHFKIVKSLSSVADTKAVSLLKDGPAWLSSSNHPETVTLRIKFVN